MNRLIVYAALVPAVLGLSAGYAVSQTVTGDMHGLVVTEEGTPLTSASVRVSAAGVRERVAVTGEDGRFRLLGLPPGAYSIAVEYIGRVPARLHGQPVRIGQTTSIPAIAMTVRPVPMAALTVEAPRPLIDPMTTARGSNLNRSTFEHLPIERDYTTMTTLLPHAALSPLGDGINIGGATGFENQFYIDGVNVSDPTLGTAGVRLPYNFVKELDVRTGGYEAEYRGALGGIVNAVTESGQNDMRVETFAFFSGRQFSGTRNLALTDRKKSDYSQFDVGGAVGGAFVRDRLWYFASYNPLIEREDIPVTGLGTLKDRNIIHRYAGKLSWQPQPATRITLTSAGDPTQGDDVGNTGGLVVLAGSATRYDDVNALLADVRSGSKTISLRATHVPNENVLLEGWIDRFDSRWSLQPRNPQGGAPYFLDDGQPMTRSVSGGLPVRADNRLGRSSAAIRMTWAAGAHTLKLGADVNGAWGEPRQFEDVITRMTEGYKRYTARFVGRTRGRSTGLFIQDSWHLSDRVRVNPGLRWNQERFYGTDDRLAMKFDNEIQPRIGVIVQPGTPGRHKITASYGRFYEDFLLTASGIYHAYDSFMGVKGYAEDPRLSGSAGEEWWALDPEPTDVLDLNGLYYDEFALGYERALGPRAKATIRAVRKELGEAVEDAWSESINAYVLGNPGRDTLSFAPRAKREYTALELSFEGSLGTRTKLLGSYVLSRNYGNYPGLYNSDYGYVFPNVNGSFDDPEFERLNEGLLPNDRTHVFKLSGWYKPPVPGMTVGTFVLWQTGTPMGEMGVKDGRDIYIGGRGALGRTPSLLDVNARIAYVLPVRVLQRGSPTLLVDVFHIGSSQKPAAFDQRHYRDEERTDVNPTFMMATQYYPPMSARLGVNINF